MRRTVTSITPLLNFRQDLTSVELVARNTPADEHSPYERLLGDALRGDNSLFTSDASVEAAWRVVDPILNHPAPLAEYECGTWPAEAMAAGVTGP